MKSNKTKPDQYSTFQDALKKVLSVSHEEMKARLEAEKKPKSSGRKKSQNSPK